jgi:hypothetical protein
MGRFVWVNPERLTKMRKQVRVDGVDISVELSPFDVPRAIVGSYDRGHGLFIIEFQYGDDEPARSAPTTEEGVSIFEGRHSGKLLKITIPVDHHPLNQVGIIALKTRILGALDKNRRDGDRGDLRTNVADEILSDEAKFEELTHDLQPV